MPKELIELNEQESLFVDNLFENGGNIRKAAVDAGYCEGHAYKLRKRLAKAITQAAQEYLSMNSLKAAVKVVDIMEGDVPMNPIILTAAQAILDRSGILKQDPYAEKPEPVQQQQLPTIKQNIFILPEKYYAEHIIEVEGKHNTGLLSVPFQKVG